MDHSAAPIFDALVTTAPMAGTDAHPRTPSGPQCGCVNPRRDRPGCVPLGHPRRAGVGRPQILVRALSQAEELMADAVGEGMS